MRAINPAFSAQPGEGGGVEVTEEQLVNPDEVYKK